MLRMPNVLRIAGWLVLASGAWAADSILVVDRGLPTANLNSGLNLPVDGGVKYSFGVWGMGREIPGGNGKGYMWFNHASNAPLAEARQDGADGVMLLFDGSGKAAGEFTGQGNGWNKNSDINVQVFAHRLSGRQTAAR